MVVLFTIMVYILCLCSVPEEMHSLTFFLLVIDKKFLTCSEADSVFLFQA